MKYCGLLALLLGSLTAVAGFDDEDTAETVRALLPEFALRGYDVTATEITDEDTGAVTFAIDCEPRGLMILLR